MILVGALLDSHVLYWQASNIKSISVPAVLAMAQSGKRGTLFVSPISIWELTNASFKPAHKDPPDLGPGPPSRWFTAAVRKANARIVPIHHRIACEAADVAKATGHKDPGDCYLIATARVKKVPIITRDSVMIALSKEGYVEVIEC